MSAFSYYYSCLGEVPHHKKKKKKTIFILLLIILNCTVKKKINLEFLFDLLDFLLLFE